MLLALRINTISYDSFRIICKFSSALHQSFSLSDRIPLGICISLLGLPLKKYHRLGDLNNRNLFSHILGAKKSKISGLVPPEAFHLGLHVATFLLANVLTLFSLCAQAFLVFWGFRFPLLIRILVILEPTHPHDLILI